MHNKFQPLFLWVMGCRSKNSQALQYTSPLLLLSTCSELLLLFAGQQGGKGPSTLTALLPGEALDRMRSGLPSSFPGTPLHDGGGPASTLTGLPALGRYNSVLNDGLFNSLQVCIAFVALAGLRFCKVVAKALYYFVVGSLACYIKLACISPYQAAVLGNTGCCCKPPSHIRATDHHAS